MNGLDVTPTKSNLLSIKDDLDLAQEGHDLLDHKREVLIHELMRSIHELKRLQQEVNDKYMKFFKLFQTASVKLGREKLELNLNFKPQISETRVIFRSIMGINVPEIQQRGNFQKPPISGLEDSCSELQKCANMAEELRDLLMRYVEAEATVSRIASEVKKTQRRVKSLENITIPKYKKAMKIISETLEENEREDFFRMKKIKSKIISRKK